MNLHKDNFLMSFHKHLILLYNTSIMPAFTEEEKSFLASMRKDFVALSQYSHPKEKGKANRIGIASSRNIFRNRSLISYAGERGISLETLESFCSEVIYSIDGIRGRQFYAIGFMNDSGGYVLRSRFTKKCTSSDLSTLKCIPENDRSSVAVFEGFFDFLSWYEDNGYCTLPCDVCVLNSVVNTERSKGFLRTHNNILIYFDNDEAGKKAAQSIIEYAATEGIMVQDMSDTFS